MAVYEKFSGQKVAVCAKLDKKEAKTSPELKKNSHFLPKTYRFLSKITRFLTVLKQTVTQIDTPERFSHKNKCPAKQKKWKIYDRLHCGIKKQNSSTSTDSWACRNHDKLQRQEVSLSPRQRPITTSQLKIHRHHHKCS